MRRVRFRDASGVVRAGEWTEDGIEAGDERYDPDGEAVEVLVPVEPTKVIGLGPNYDSNIESYDREWPESPADLTVFFKMVPHSLVAHGRTATLRGPGEFHHELELGVVVGEQLRDATPAAAEDAIAGFTCVNEITNKEPPACTYDQDRNWGRAKAMDDSAPIGPVVATPDEVPADAAMELRVNGETRQRDGRDGQIFSEAEVLAELSAYLTLEPGDVVATGSPIGVAPMEDGDRVEVEIEGIGTLVHDVHIPDA